MMNANQLLTALAGQSRGGVVPAVPGALTQKVKGLAEMAKGETVKNRQFLRVNKGDQQILFYATTLRKRKK